MKTTEEKITKLVNNIKQKHGKNMQFILCVYKDEESGLLKSTQNLESNSPDTMVGILEKIKVNIIQELIKIDKKGKKK